MKKVLAGELLEIRRPKQIVCSLEGADSIAEVFDWLSGQVGRRLDNTHEIWRVEQFDIVQDDRGLYSCVATCAVLEDDDQ